MQVHSILLNYILLILNDQTENRLNDVKIVVLFFSRMKMIKDLTWYNWEKSNKGWILKFLIFSFLAITTSNLHQIQKKGQFWNLLILRISKLTLLLIFDQVKAEKIEVKDTKGHFQFSHFQVISSNFSE